MPRYAFTPPPPIAIPVDGEDVLFPVRRILCVGRNYADHAREMGADTREPPFFFAKPADAIVVGDRVPYPKATQDLHHEVELVIALGAAADNISPTAACDHIFGYAVGVDLTRRDLQAAAKAKQHPWEAGKAFDASAVLSPLRRWSGPLPDRRIQLSVNGEVRQDGSISDMIWTAPEVVAEASNLWRLEAGDLIFTGTPAGVGALRHGDAVEGSVEGIGRLSFRID